MFLVGYIGGGHGAGLYLRKQSASGTTPDVALSLWLPGHGSWRRPSARAKRTLVDAGRDPRLEKQSEIDAQLKASAARKARGKFKELADDWYETEIAGGHLKHPAVPRRYLDKYMVPEFGSAVPADITPAMAARLLARVGKKAPTAANDLLRYTRRVFRFAVAGVSHGLDEFTIRDLRRTMRTHLSSLGIRGEVAERCLNRKLPGIQGVYNTHDYFAERKAALETWTALLLEIERGERKLTPMRSRRSNS